MSYGTCEKCRGPMDPLPDVYCCICTPPCKLSFCWKCNRAWQTGPCARAMLRELRDSPMLEAYSSPPKFAMDEPPPG